MVIVLLWPLIDCCRDLYSKGSYRMSLVSEKLSEVRLPAKWMALESLEYFVFTTRSDVW